MVAFIDPRQSRVDIAQAVGRAMRKPRGTTTKTVGYVFVPLFLGSEGESIDDAINSSKFNVVADVLNALQEHDAALNDCIKEMRRKIAFAPIGGAGEFESAVSVIAPRVTFSDIENSIRAEIVERLGSNWDRFFGYLAKYREEKGNALVPAEYFTEDGVALGQWARQQRHRVDSLTVDRFSALVAVGFNFRKRGESFSEYTHRMQGIYGRLGLSPLESVSVKKRRWEKHFDALCRFHANTGHTRVPRLFTSDDGLRLGEWVNRQRNRDALSEEQYEKLKQINFDFPPMYAEKREQEAARRAQEAAISQVKREQEAALKRERWQKHFDALCRFHADTGHTRVPRLFTSDDGLRLGEWVNRQRNRNVLTKEQRAKLNELGFLWRLR
jgi:hypothetical protein